MKRGAVFEDEEPEVSRNSQTAPLSTDVPSDQYQSPSHASSSEAKYTLEQEEKESKEGPLEPLPGDVPSDASAPAAAPHPHHHMLDPHYLLQRTAEMGGAVWTSVKETSTSLFGVKFVWIERPQGGSVCTFVVQDEIKLAAWVVIILLGIVVAILAIINLMTGKVSFESITEKKHYVAIIISAAFSIGATYITRVQVKAHYANWTHPKAQIKIVRIVLMVPIYAWSAWIGLAVIELAPYVDFVRICYEAYVIYNFLLLLTKYLGGHVGVVAVLKEKPEQMVKWPQPFCCFPRAHLGSTFLWAIKYGTMQYVIITPLISFGAVILAMFGLYHDGVMDWHSGYIYVMIIQNVTQLTALYCLVWYYVIMKDDLKPFHPLAKFLVVKSVVFFTFWQGVAINIMVRIGWIEDESDLSAAEVQLGLQDFIICIEMFIAAAVHRYTFGHEDFANGTFQGMIEECRARAVRKQDEITKDDMGEVFFDLEIEHPEFEAPDADTIQIKNQQIVPVSAQPTIGDPSLIVPARSGGFAVGGGDVGMTQMAAVAPTKQAPRSGAGGWKVM